MGKIFAIDHKWGKGTWWLWSPPIAEMTGVYSEYKDPKLFPSINKEFDKEYAKERGAKDKNVKNLLHLARKALANGNLKGFHDTMTVAETADPKHPVVKTYVQPNCSTVVHMAHDTYGTVDNCSMVGSGGSVTLNVPDDLSKAKSAPDPPGYRSLRGL